MGSLKSRLIIAFIIIQLSNIIVAGYDTISTLKSPNKLVTVNLTGDLHSAPKEIHERQRKEQEDVFTELSKLSKETLHVIAEDMADCPQEPEGVKEYANVMQKSSACSALADVMQLCRKYDLPATNAEYRFKRSASLSPFYRNSETYRALAETITTDDILQEHTAVVDEIQNYTDNAKLGCYYTDLLSNTRNMLQPLLSTFANHHDSIASYIETEIPSSNRQSFAYGLLHFDVAMLDARILHTIYEHMTKSALDMQPRKVLVFAGKCHTYTIGKKLEELLNFTQEKSIGTHRPISYPLINFNAYSAPQVSRTVAKQQPASIQSQDRYLDGKTLSEYLLE